MVFSFIYTYTIKTLKHIFGEWKYMEIKHIGYKLRPKRTH